MHEGNAESALQTRESVQMYELMSEHESARASVQMHVRASAQMHMRASMLIHAQASMQLLELTPPAEPH